MRFYPRGLKRELRDEYRSDLAPSRELFRDFKNMQQQYGHDEGFLRSTYEARFKLSSEALKRLAELAELSRKKDVYLVCQCELGEKCHREMLMMIAKENFKARIGKIFNQYPIIEKRIIGDAFTSPMPSEI